MKQKFGTISAQNISLHEGTILTQIKFPVLKQMGCVNAAFSLISSKNEHFMLSKQHCRHGHSMESTE